MYIETAYSPGELEEAACTCCGEYTDEVVIEDGRCVGCIEEEKFIEWTMQEMDKEFPDIF